MECATTLNDPFRCPTKWELWRQTLDLLPPGRAWQNHEEVAEFAGNVVADLGDYELGGPIGMGAEENVQQLTRLQQYWAGYAEVSAFLHQRACALLEEFFCATTQEQRDEWAIDYGFPDPCEPWLSLCEKVAAQGGATCAYLVQIAAASGWVIDCADCGGVGADSRAGRMIAGADCNSPCGCPVNTIFIRVYLDQSPSYKGRFFAGQAGLMRAGCDTGCGPNIDGLLCLLERFKPAHVKAIYEPLGG